MVTIDGFGGTYRSFDLAIKAAIRHNNQWKYPNKVTKIRDAKGNLVVTMQKKEVYDREIGDYVMEWVPKYHPIKKTVKTKKKSQRKKR